MLKKCQKCQKRNFSVLTGAHPQRCLNRQVRQAKWRTCLIDRSKLAPSTGNATFAGTVSQSTSLIDRSKQEAVSELLYREE